MILSNSGQSQLENSFELLQRILEQSTVSLLLEMISFQLELIHLY